MNKQREERGDKIRSQLCTLFAIEQLLGRRFHGSRISARDGLDVTRLLQAAPAPDTIRTESRGTSIGGAQ